MAKKRARAPSRPGPRQASSPSGDVSFDGAGGYSYTWSPNQFEITQAPRPASVGAVVKPPSTAYDAIYGEMQTKVPEATATDESSDVQGASVGGSVGATESESDGGGGGLLGMGMGLIGAAIQDMQEDANELIDDVEGAWDLVVDWWKGPEPDKDIDLPMPKAPAVDELTTLMARERLSPEQIARARELIAEAPQGRQGDLYEELQSKVQYENQRNNESDGEGKYGGTCNVTSLAMALQYLGISNPHPEMQYADALDKIRVDNNYGALTVPSTWTKISEHLGVSTEQLHSGDALLDRTWWEGEALPKLRSGYGIIISIAGHIVRLEGMDERGLIVDDPYGASLLGRPRGDGSGKEYGWAGSNGTSVDGTDESNVGEDLGYPWEDVNKHHFRSVYAYK